MNKKSHKVSNQKVNQQYEILKHEHREQLIKLRDAEPIGNAEKIKKIEVILRYGHIPLWNSFSLAPNKVNLHNLAILITYFSDLQLDVSRLSIHRNLFQDLNKLLCQISLTTIFRDLPNDNIYKWKSKPFCALLVLILDNNLHTIEIQNLLKHLRSLQADLIDIDSIYSECEAKQRELEEINKKISGPDGHFDQETSFKKGKDSASSKQHHKNPNVLKASLRNIEKVCKLVEAHFPWPVDNLSIHALEIQKLKELGITVSGKRAWKYDLMPIEYDSVSKSFSFETEKLAKWRIENRSSKSYFEPYTYKFPDAISKLVEDYQEFCRYLNHKRRYLVKSVYLDLAFLENTFSLRIDQVAIHKKNQELYGRWITSLFGVPESLHAVIKQLDFVPIRELKEVKSISLTAEQMKYLDKVFVVQSITPERMRTYIGRFLELFVLVALEPNLASSLRVQEFSEKAKSERELIFETAIRKTFWDSGTQIRDSVHKCQICHQPIWDGPSLARMMGPECWKKYRFTEKGQALISIADGRKIDQTESLRLAIPFQFWISNILADFRGER